MKSFRWGQLSSRVTEFADTALPLICLLVVTSVVCLQINSLVRALIAALINLIFVLGLFMFSGNSGIISFGQMAFALIGAYVGGVLTVPLTVRRVLLPDLVPWLKGSLLQDWQAVLVAAAIAAIVSIPIGLLILHLNGIVASIATFSVLIIMHTLATNIGSLTNGSAGIAGIPITAGGANTLVWALIALGVVLVFQVTARSRRLQASREDLIAAQSLGIHEVPDRLVAWAVSAGFCGASGALYAQFVGSFNPDNLYLPTTFATIAMLVVGGLTSVWGAVVGTFAISTVSEVLHRAQLVASLNGLPSLVGLPEVSLAIIMIVVLIIRPQGITRGRELRISDLLTAISSGAVATRQRHWVSRWTK